MMMSVQALFNSLDLTLQNLCRLSIVNNIKNMSDRIITGKQIEDIGNLAEILCKQTKISNKLLTFKDDLKC